VDETVDFLFEQLPRARRTLRVAIVTEAYPPEVNGAARTAARFVEGLRRREHEIQLVRPRRGGSDSAGATDGLREVLTRGVPIPLRPDLRLGLPATRALARRWAHLRPDVVHVLTQGPLAWSALRAARQLRLPVVSDFTGFLGYRRRYGAGWLSKPILAYLRKFHNRALWTLVPNETLCAELTALGFRNVRVHARNIDASLVDVAPDCDPVIKQLETLLELAAAVAPVSYGTSGEGRTRTPMPQST
jgi:hypothetical protein